MFTSILVKLRHFSNLKINKLILKTHICHTSINPTMASTKIKRVVNDILKPLQDDRFYRGIELTNGMQVLLISDPTTDKSSAALDVNIGAMSDPVNLPGLAHFCEHMLFLGTEKYPVENDYDKFLTDHGGSSNACTTCENTNYYFDISPEFFSQALERFAQFFICPLFTESATSRELNAVNSENDKNLKNDSRRIHQLERSLCRPGHDFGKFSTGNRESLETTPKKSGINVREELLKFHAEHYSSNTMTLAVLSKESLDELTELVASLFNNVKNKSLVKPHWNEHPFGPEQAKKHLSVVPVKDIRSLTITWSIPDLHPHYKTSPGHYLGHLIGHEGPGSLLSELKNKGWVNTLSAGENSGARGFMFFVLDVDLTEQGIEHVEDIVAMAFQYMEMLRQEGVQEWVYKECQVLSDIDFKFKDKESPSTFTSSCSSAIQLFPLNEVLSAGYYYEDYKPQLIESILKLLTPENMRLRVVGKKFEGFADQVEKWYGTQYKMENLPEASVKKWQEVGLNPSFHLPHKNLFIPHNLQVLPLSPQSPTSPSTISHSKERRVWYCRDDTFKLPKSCFITQIVSPKAYSDPLSKNYTHLFIDLLKDSLNEFSYSARLAGISYDIYNNIYGLQMSLGGYSDKQEGVLSKVLERLCSGQVDEKRFHILLENYIRALKNFQTEQPYQQASYYTSILVSEQAWTKQELLENTEGMTYEGLLRFIPELFAQVFIETLAYGNITEEKAKEMVEMVEGGLRASFKTRALPASQQKKIRQVQLSDGCSFKYLQENSVQNCSSLELYLQCGLQESRANMVLELLCQAISEPCYDMLRTQEQLGYIVFSGLRRAHGVQGLRIIVQSDRTPTYVEKRVEAFIENMKDFIDKMDEEQFQTHVNALASKRLEKPKKMWSQNSKYWSEISNQFYNFNRDEVEVKELRLLRKSDIKDLYNELIAHDAPKRHKLSVHVLSTAATSAPATDEAVGAFEAKEWVEVVDLNTFKQQLPLFAVPLPAMLPHKSKL